MKKKSCTCVNAHASKRIIEDTKRIAVIKFKELYGDIPYDVHTWNTFVEVHSKVFGFLVEPKRVEVYYGKGLTLP